MRTVSVRYLLMGLIALSSLNSLYWAARRYRLEQGYRRVELVVDMDEVQRLADARKASLGTLLSRLRQAGITGAAISEPTIQELAESGALTVLTPELAAQMFPEHSVEVRAFDVLIATSRPQLGDQIVRQLEAKCAEPPRVLLTGDRTVLVGIHGGKETLTAMGVGMRIPQVAMVRGSGLHVVARLSNYPSIHSAAIRFMIGEAARRGAKVVVFRDDEVVGYGDLISDTARTLKKDHVLFGQVEFARQRGARRLAEEARPFVLRVHSINESELYGLSAQESLQRFVRAVRERNIRVCYIHLLPQARRDSLQTNFDYLQALSKALREAGFVLDEVGPFPSFSAPGWARAATAVGVAAALTCLGQQLLGWTPVTTAWALCLGLLLLPAVSFQSATTGSKLVALLAAIAFPSLAMTSGLFPSLWRRSSPTVLSVYRILIDILRATGITLLGAVAVVTLLANDRFMLKVDQFSGVKLAELTPLLIVTVAYVGQLLRDRQRTFSGRLRVARRELQRLWAHPLLLGHALLLMVVMAGTALLLMRSGNEPGVGISSLEMKLRTFLEQTLIARPRTKEFLLAHPAYVAALLLAVRGRLRWTVPLIVLATVGQVSILNTFCHIHTPLSLSLLRTFNGLWLGIGIGLLGVGAGEGLMLRWSGPPESRLDAAAAKARRRMQENPPRTP